MLSEQRLRLNSRTQFNDPFDSYPIIENDLSTSAIRNYWDDAIRNPVNANRSSESVLRLLESDAARRTHLNRDAVRNIKAHMYQATQDFLDDAGQFSFSLTAENPLLWGHYAASFTGLCIIFRRSASTSSALSMCASVSYVKKRPRLPMSLFHRMTMNQMAGKATADIANELLFLSFLHKSCHWAHEREVRLFSPFDAFKKLSFDPSELNGFILGPKSSSELQQKMKTEIKTRRPSVALYESSLSQTDFRIVIPHKFSQRHRHPM
jgi:hypothetical protein